MSMDIFFKIYIQGGTMYLPRYMYMHYLFAYLFDSHRDLFSSYVNWRPASSPEKENSGLVRTSR